MITFETPGLIPLESFTVFGMSAKPGTTNPLGKFGTGLKNSVAIILRLGGTIRLFRGNEEFVFYTSEVDFRGATFAKVRMKKRKRGWSPWRYESLPFTTELGKHWKPWMAFRELEANTRDENGTTRKGDAIEPRDGVSLIIVDCPEIEAAFADISTIFLDRKEAPLYEDERVTIYDDESDYVFYRGMRVTDLRRPTLYTYEMKSINLTEDRTSMYSFLDDQRIMTSLLACDDRGIVENVVNNSEGCHEETFNWDGKAPSVSPAWRPALSHSGVGGRFSSLRDNLDYGIARNDDVEVMLEVHEWETVLGYMFDCAAVDEDLRDDIEKQLTEAGWRKS